ncbi:hypothetical protein EVAR_38834_1 [Eumeta japonica]|uniref:Uncharacterized protein n=1 Tax=Eumeta variegata TaxID=151549 RepID=A0A4C1XTF7_EUMVA|nr:hypothetical protein EVAR_38834_1 [Eumeta japonica]
MPSRDTVSGVEPFLVLEHLYCLNRTHLMDSWKTKSLCLLFNCLSFAYTLAMNVFIHYEYRVNASMVWLQVISLIYLLYLFYAARRNRQSFEMLREFDEIFGGDDKCHFLLKNKASLATTLLLTSSISDVIVWHYVAGYVYYSCMWAVVFSRECELLLYGLLIESINLKLIGLDGAKPSKGALVYRQALMCSAKIYQEFELRVNIFHLTTIGCSHLLLIARYLYSPRNIPAEAPASSLGGDEIKPTCLTLTQ